VTSAKLDLIMITRSATADPTGIAVVESLTGNLSGVEFMESALQRMPFRAPSWAGDVRYITKSKSPLQKTEQPAAGQASADDHR
jgi:hypothetical protein